MWNVLQALLAAWKDACESTRHSEMVIPRGDFNVGRLKLEGPCKAPITMKLQGTLKAPADVNKLPKTTEWISIMHVEGFTLTGGGIIDGQGADTWAKKKLKKLSFVQPLSLGLSYLTNALIQDITSLDAKMFHINVLGGKNVTFEHVTIKAPDESPNTDGIHIGRSYGVRVNNCPITTGDDCISIGDGAQQVTVTKVTCGPGHGFAIGSLGQYNNEEPVRGIFFKSSSLTGTTNGVRIKTWENSPVGEASDIHFEDIQLTNVLNPIIIDQEYCPSGKCPNSDPPSRVRISNVSFKNIKGTSASKEAVKIVCSKSVPCQGVEIGDIHLTYNGRDGAITSTCKNVKPILSGKQYPSVCTAKRDQEL
ncbi:hypothetical protein LIER_32532 [Lithospermum erythrorhizon]|uniref:Polygalacturonase n=1 Tax=Lithospermum erythrorhizon TaxID=34254 RepID=A0AAV3RV16_LITER